MTANLLFRLVVMDDDHHQGWYEVDQGGHPETQECPLGDSRLASGVVEIRLFHPLSDNRF